MKFRTILPLATLALVAPLCAQEKAMLKDQKDKAGYAIGTNIGTGLKRDAVEINIEALIAGLRDSFNGAASQLPPAEQQAALKALQQEMGAKASAQQQQMGSKAKKEGEDFLAQNKAKDGVKTLPNGLQYKVLQEGSGASPTASDQVSVNYRGTLVDGTEFDSSYKRGEPATFGVGQVIPGWTQALQLMKTGAKWQLFIPSELADGERGAGGDIPPHSALIFEVELLSIKK